MSITINNKTIKLLIQTSHSEGEVDETLSKYVSFNFETYGEKLLLNRHVWRQHPLKQAIYRL